jgi:hypothetical protein
MLGASPSPRPGGGAAPPAETIPAREPSFARKALPLQRAVVAHSNQKAETMSAEQLKERLHLRIEQADERLLAVLAEIAESLFKAYPPKAVTPSDGHDIRPLTRQELTSEIEASMAEYERGEYISLEESKRESASW